MNKKCLVISLGLLLASGSICSADNTCPIARQKPTKAPGFYGLFLKSKDRSPEELAAYEQSGGSPVRYRRLNFKPKAS